MLSQLFGGALRGGGEGRVGRRKGWRGGREEREDEGRGEER